MRSRSPPRLFYGWVVVAVATIAMVAATFTGGAGFSVFIQPMAEDLGWSRTVLAGGLSAGTVAGALLAPLFGWLADRFGARLMLAACGLGIAATLGAVSTVAHPTAFVVSYGLARAIDMGALNVAVTTAVCNWFVRRRGRALGLAMAGNALGVMVLVPAAQWLIDGPGWRAAWLILGAGSGLLLAGLAAWLVRRRPEDLGLRPDGGAVTVQSIPPSLPAAAEPAWTPAEAMRLPAFWALVLASTLGQVAVSGLTTHQVSLLLENGVGPAAAAGAVSVYGLAWAVGSLVWGGLAERLPSRYTLALCFGLVAICAVAILGVRAALLVVPYALAYGLANGGKEALDALVWADYFGRRSVGAIRGLSRPFVVGGGALGPFIGGLGYDLSGGYGLVMMLLATIAAVGSLTALAARPPAAPVRPLPARG